MVSHDKTRTRRFSPTLPNLRGGGGDVPRKKLVVWPPLVKFGLIKSIGSQNDLGPGKTALPKDGYMSIVNTKYFDTDVHFLVFAIICETNAYCKIEVYCFHICDRYVVSNLPSVEISSSTTS